MKTSQSGRSLREQASAGGRWTAISAIAGLLIQLIQLAILGRLLYPSDFGLMAMMLVVIGLASLLADFGVSNYLVQTKRLTGRLFASLLVLCIAGALLLAGLLCLAAPLVATFFDAPLLINLLPALGLVVVATAVFQPFFALLQREMRFKQIAIMETSAALVGLMLTVAMAMLGYGVWSLIGGQLVLAAAKAVLCVGMASSLVRFEWKFDWPEMKQAMCYGYFQMGERLLNYASWNIDKLIVGRALGEGSLGIYSIAYQLVIKPFSILNPIFTRVALPLLAKVQDDDPRLVRGYLEMTRTIALIAFPVYLFMILASDSIVLLLLGPKWLEAASLVALLGGLGFVYSLGNPIGSLLLAKGRADWAFYFNGVAVVVYALAVVMGSNLGLNGVAIGLLIAAVVMFSLEFVLRWFLVRMSPWVYLRAIAHIVTGTLLPLLIGSLILTFQTSEPGGLLFGFFVGGFAVGIYFAYMWLAEQVLLKNTLNLILQK